MHLQPLYKKNKFITFKDKDESKNIYNNGICLSGSSLAIEKSAKIIDIIKSFL